MPELAVGIAAAVIGVAVVTWFSIWTWSVQRRKEREAYYRFEALKRLAEQPGGAGNQALELMREEEQRRRRRAREGIKLAGMLVFVFGVATFGLLKRAEPNEAHYVLSFFPLLIGATLLVYAYVLAPRD